MNLLLAALRDPPSIRRLAPAEWDLLVRQASHDNLLGRLHGRLQRAGVEADIPERPRNHLLSGAIMAEQQNYSIRREACHLRDALASRDIPLILLKGAAYVAAGLPAAQGRLFADVDILVPRERLDDAESALLLTGWQSTVSNAYDQRYNRRWMHELPAMRHLFRGTTLDVHHTILPPTARLKPDARLLIEASVEIPDLPGVRTLALEDLILHSASHLFHEGEPDNLLCDLTDLDLLLKHLGRDDAAWDALLARAEQLQLSGPLSLALCYTERLLDTPIPARIRHRAGNDSTGNAGQRLLDLLYSRILRPQHPSTADRFTSVARKALYIRAHWLRMPPLLLAYHLAHPKGKPESSTLGARLCGELTALETGKSSWRGFEKLGVRIIEFLFDGIVVGGRQQRITEDGLNRFDFIARVVPNSWFWEFVVRQIDSTYVVFEFKNYADRIRQAQITTTEKYLFANALRRLAIIFTRKGATDEAQQMAFGAMRESGKLILVLDDTQVCEMLAMRDRGDDPSDFLFEIADDFLMKLSR